MREKADLETVLAEFEAHDEKDGWLMHPRTRAVLEEQEKVASRGSAGASKRCSGKSLQTSPKSAQRGEEGDPDF